MITLVEKQQIILRHLNNESNRKIASDLGIDKNEIRCLTLLVKYLVNLCTVVIFI